MAYCEKCGSPVESNLDDKGKHRDSSKYYFRCTGKDCAGRTGVAVVREKPETENKGGK
jgi:hypothetical protein